MFIFTYNLYRDNLFNNTFSLDLFRDDPLCPRLQAEIALSGYILIINEPLYPRLQAEMALGSI